MSDKNTAGPWFIDQYGHVYGWSERHKAEKATVKESVCLIDSRHSAATVLDKVLIAAAPDLKAALENALRSMEYAAMALEAPEKCALRENIEQAKEALKKAGLE